MGETTPQPDEYAPGEEFRQLPRPSSVAELPAWWRERAKQMRACARGLGTGPSATGTRGRAIGLVRAADELAVILATDPPPPAAGPWQDGGPSCEGAYLIEFVFLGAVAHGVGWKSVPFGAEVLRYAEIHTGSPADAGGEHG